MLKTALVQEKRCVVLNDVTPPYPASPGPSDPAPDGPGAGAEPNNAGAATGPPQGALPLKSRAQIQILGTVTESAATIHAVTLTPSESSSAGLLIVDSVLVVDVSLCDGDRVLDTVVARGKASSTQVLLQLQGGKTKLVQAVTSSWSAAARKAIAAAAHAIGDRLSQIPWEGRVADIEGDGAGVSVFVNAGSVQGVRPGDVLEVFHPGAAIRDPDTGEVIGRRQDLFLARLQVASVSAGVATARPTQPVGANSVQVGDVVHYVGAGPAPGGTP